MPGDPAYESYWARKELLIRSKPRFPVVRWWETERLCEIERIYFEAVRGASSLLDVGAGDLRIQRKLNAAGFAGEYHTQDIGLERSYTYSDLAAIRRSYGAILCLDVLEHLTLQDGMALLGRLASLLEPDGVLVLQTGNALYLPEPRAWDMTHLHSYNGPDLWAYFTAQGFDATVYRIVLGPERRGPIDAARFRIQAWVKEKILGCDYANNIAVIARKRKVSPSS